MAKVEGSNPFIRFRAKALQIAGRKAARLRASTSVGRDELAHWHPREYTPPELAVHGLLSVVNRRHAQFLAIVDVLDAHVSPLYAGP